MSASIIAISVELRVVGVGKQIPNSRFEFDLCLLPLNLDCKCNDTNRIGLFISNCIRVIDQIFIEMEIVPDEWRGRPTIEPSAEKRCVLKTVFLINRKLYDAFSLNLRMLESHVARLRNIISRARDFQTHNRYSPSIPIGYVKPRDPCFCGRPVKLDTWERITQHECCLLFLFFQLPKNNVRADRCGRKAYPSGRCGKPLLHSAVIRLADVGLNVVGKSTDVFREQHNACQHQKRQHGNVEPTVILHSLTPANENLFSAGNALLREAV
ncbi:protein of unknown function [Agrobacterium pusense]|uniref:Uncharacterized protein n=1 Tax=Agrobacterium pusense TaxID=648995 RepID=U4Q4N7_9HYPH|nr:protein of unknown function [Agrobacterium pusense]